MNKVRVISVNAPGTGQIAFHFKEYMLVCSGLAGNTTIWNALTGDLVHQLDAPTDDVVASIDFSSDGTTLVTSGNHSGLHFWNTQSWSLFRTIDAPKGRIHKVSFSADGHTIARANFTEKVIELWDLKIGQLTKKIAFGPFAFHPIKPEIAVGNGANIDFYYLSTGDLIRTEAIGELITGSLLFSTDGQRMVAETEAENICVMRSNEMKIRHIIGQGSLLRYPVFSPDGQIIAAADTTGFVRLWHTETSEEIVREVAEFDMPNSLAFSRDGNLLACGSGGVTGGIVEIWRIH